jgi:hypothetical protein
LHQQHFLQHQILEVSIGGNVCEKRAASFRLMTQTGFPSMIARLVYPSDTSVPEGTAVGAIDDEITVSLTSGDKTDLYFIGTVYSVNTHGAHCELLLTDSYKKLCDTEAAAAYRKEKASSILDDILGAAGATEKSITCPDVELARFSTQTIPARYCIDLLFDALTEHGEKGLVYFFDEKDTFHFGKMGIPERTRARFSVLKRQRIFCVQVPAGLRYCRIRSDIPKR